MDFELSDDQAALRDAARDLLSSGATSERVRAVVDGEVGYDADLWKQISTQGWLALELHEGAGGLGLGFVEVAVLAEQIGRFVAPVPFVSTTLVLGVLDAIGDQDERIERLATGDLIGAAGVVGEPVVDAPYADVAVLLQRDGSGVSVVDLSHGAPAAEPAMDRTRRVAWLDAEGVGTGNADVGERLRDRAAVAYAASMLGASERMLEVATDYARTREQFGRAIGSFQAVKHMLADMLVDVEGMRSAVYAAAWSVATDASDRSLAASSAKAWCGEASRRVLESALQVHGGIGFTWEHDLHLYLKRAHLDRTVFGDPSSHLRRVARLLEERVAAGTDLW